MDAMTTKKKLILDTEKPAHLHWKPSSKLHVKETQDLKFHFHFGSNTVDVILFQMGKATKTHSDMWDVKWDSYREVLSFPEPRYYERKLEIAEQKHLIGISFFFFLGRLYSKT